MPPKAAAVAAADAQPAAKAKQRSWLRSIGLGHAATLACVAYLWYGGTGMYRIVSPLSGVPESAYEPPILPLWAEGEPLLLTAYLSHSTRYTCGSGSSEATLLWNATGELSEGAAPLHRKLLLSADADPAAGSGEAERVRVTQSLMRRLQRNSFDGGDTAAAVLHVCVTSAKGGGGPWRFIQSTTPLTKEGPKPLHLGKRWLLQDLGLGRWSGVSPWADPSERNVHENATVVPLWKPELAIHVIAGQHRFPSRVHVPQVHPHLTLRFVTPDGRVHRGAPHSGALPRYLPPMYISEMGMSSEQFIALNASVRSLPLTLHFEPTHLVRWLVLNHFEGVLRNSQGSFGLQERDWDEVRQMIVGTNVWLFSATVVASVLHLLFEFLAMKSDIAFWKQNKSLQGLSVRTLFFDLFFYVVITLYLIEEESSLLITVPMVVQVFIQMWKCRRATGISLEFSRRGISVRCERWEREGAKRPAPAPGATAAQKEAKEAGGSAASLDLDRRAIRAMSVGLVPLCVAYCLWSLLRHPHRSWYAWLLDSMSGAVYAFGFVLMTPQLFINYKLKSVAHLPWRFLCYRFLNTFIDDLFAFIIHMPVMHRLSCFRDDIVFLIYLYQRRIYRVDHSRPSGYDEDG
eukprot:TRINITY_DN65963_c0_g1_i1.p1 TRINITY_DN65963_c0_g1~~TRINITY_DN65963_c0_g1_i1.p1  ORF type:complete len:629 (+),score=227.91 TRINITY_DN65963_c0_g1_i1:70-1956(+)